MLPDLFVSLNSVCFPKILGLLNPKTVITKYRRYSLLWFYLALIIVPAACLSTKWYIVSVQRKTNHDGLYIG